MSSIDDRLRDFFYRYDKGAPLDAREETVEEADAYTKLHVSFASTHNERVPGTLYLPRNARGPRPAVILQHGASTTKDDHYIQQPSRRWCEAGYVCMAIDAPLHGERAQGPALSRQELWRRGFIYRMRDQRIQGVVDLMRALDYLEQRPEVDIGRVGYMGVSMGTFLGVPFVALDQRVRCAVFIIGGGNLQRTMGMSGGMDAEGAALVFQVTDPVCFAGRIAPRPVLMLNGERDEVVPRAAGEALYEALGEPKAIRWFDMEHTVTGEVYRHTFAFLREQLGD